MTDSTLEEKLLELQSIRKQLEQSQIPLSQSFPLLERAFKLKKEIEKELNEMQNRLIDLSKQEDVKSED
jgi:exodeoxyribonuclease VII small subunit